MPIYHFSTRGLLFFFFVREFSYSLRTRMMHTATESYLTFLIFQHIFSPFVLRVVYTPTKQYNYGRKYNAHVIFRPEYKLILYYVIIGVRFFPVGKKAKCEVVMLTLIHYRSLQQLRTRYIEPRDSQLLQVHSDVRLIG